MERKFKLLALTLIIVLLVSPVWAEKTEDLRVIENTAEEGKKEQSQPKLVSATNSIPNNTYYDPVRYTLGPEDVVEITVLRHPEFSGTYPINMEGKIQYKYVGDLDVTGLTKKELEDKVREIISTYVIDPEINVTILEYRSKVIYVLGEVGNPGKYYMRAEAIPVREAVVAAGLPTLAAAMRKCRLITPDKDGNAKQRTVDLYSILYGGDLKHNIDMHPGEVLYVPATVMAKIMRVISPVAAPVGAAASGKGSATTLITGP